MMKGFFLLRNDNKYSITVDLNELVIWIIIANVQLDIPNETQRKAGTKSVGDPRIS